jgi:hypothetical protein
VATIDIDAVIAIAEAGAREALHGAPGAGYERWRDRLIAARMIWIFLLDFRYTLGPRVPCTACGGTGRTADGWQGRPVPAGCSTCQSRGSVVAEAA